MPLKLVQQVHDLIKTSEKFTDKEQNLYIPKILEAIEQIDDELIKLLISDEKTKNHFFTKVEDVYILNQNKLIEFFTMNEYSKNSYTSYTNKIGLIKKDSFIKKFDDVVLAWPHKDCILEGGQSKDDEKNNEVFYNEILSSDEIDRLFEPKALTNIKRYTKDGMQENPQITKDDNLIIKGNNLIALHSLKKKYAGKVKLIYIDPPYNTGNDSFKYNDRFNHSTWLTFMKNRLEVAREFLSEDGVIFVQCDDNEQAYLKVLMDEVFGIGQFIGSIIWKKRSGTNDSKTNFSSNHDYIIIFSKLDNAFLLGEKKHFTNYTNPDNDPRGKWTSGDLTCNKTAIERPNLYYDIVDPVTNKVYKCNANRVWRTTKDKMLKLIEEGKILFPKKDDGTPSYKRHLNEVRSDRQPVSSIFLNDALNQIGTKEILNLFGNKVFSYPKPEQLIHKIIDISTQPNDLVMDFHLGSGTTCAVAHKMGRRYIGIEQMDYIEDIAVERMKKVLDGEQGGISKSVDWNGGGSFIYAELKQIDHFKDAEIGKLNANMHYLPVAEIEDAEYGMSDEEIKINKAFYGIENE